MKKVLFFFAAIIIFAANAQAQTTVYTDGNVRIDQYSDGWKIILGNTVMAFGDGVLDVDNLPPAFQDMLDAYAKMEEPKAKKSLSKNEVLPTQYGPLLKTTWSQSAPYNNLCPQITYKANETDETLTKSYTQAGCSSISTAQVLNYYGYCKSFSSSGTLSFASYEYHESNPKEFDLFVSDFYKKDGDDYTYTFPEYTPDFAKIAANNAEEIAKFVAGIGLVQKASYGKGATWTETSNQIDALIDVFGYAVQKEGNKNQITINNLTDLIVIKTIKSAKPIIIGSSNNDNGGHSYIIDGYMDKDNGFVHVNYGYGGNTNGWFSDITTTRFPNNPSIIIAYPNYENFASMQNIPNNIPTLIVDNANGEILSNDPLCTSYKVSLKAGGDHTFYFLYSNSQKIAPYTAGEKIILGNGNRSYTKRGCFTSEPATIQVENNCDLVFYHDVAHGEIRVEMYESEQRKISGNVKDEKDQAISGATIYATATGEQEIASQNIPGKTIDQHGRSASELLIDFVPTTNYITGFNINIIKNKNPEKKMKIEIMSNIDVADNPVSEWSQEYDPSVFSENEYIRLDQQFANPIKVTKGQVYYIKISNMVQDAEQGIRYYCKLNEDRTLIYTVFGVDGYAKTDNDGNYTLNISDYWMGKLTAQYDHKVFDTLEVNNYFQSLINKNFSTDGSEKYGPLSIDANGVATLNGNYDGIDEMKLTSDINVSQVTLERTFTKDVYSTIILPFEANPSEIADGKFYTFNSVKYVIPKGKTEYQWTAFVDELSSDATLSANTPYIFKASKNVENLTWNVTKTLEKTPTTISSGTSPWVFKGVYQTKTWYKQTKTDYGFAGVQQESKGISIGDFVRAGNGSIIRPFRCYLTYTGTQYEALLSKSAVVLPERIEVCVIKHDETAAVIEPSESVEPSADDITTPVSEIAADNSVKVWSYEKTIFIEGQSGVNYRIFDANGRLLKSDVTRSDREEIAVNRHGSGIAIVIAGGKTWKVAY